MELQAFEQVAGLLMSDDCFGGSHEEAVELAHSILALPEVSKPLRVLGAFAALCSKCTKSGVR